MISRSFLPAFGSLAETPAERAQVDRGTGAYPGETRVRLRGETNEGFESLPGTPPTG